MKMLLTLLLFTIIDHSDGAKTYFFNTTGNTINFKIRTGFSTYAQAKQHCSTNNMVVVTITSENERQLVEENIKTLTGSVQAYWIGLEYNQTAKTWSNLDGSFPAYTNFRVKPSTTGNQNVMANQKANDGKWDMVPVGSQPTKNAFQAVICKKYIQNPDEVKDCVDDSDCPAEKERCQAGKCILGLKTCTTFQDCPQEDRKDPQECRNGICALASKVCESNDDCGDLTKSRCSDRLCVNVEVLGKTCTGPNDFVCTVGETFRICDIVDNVGYCVVANIDPNTQ